LIAILANATSGGERDPAPKKAKKGASGLIEIALFKQTKPWALSWGWAFVSCITINLPCAASKQFFVTNP
jgi:hypothetical protein